MWGTLEALVFLPGIQCEAEMLTLLLVVTVSICLCADVQPVLGNSFTFPQNCKNDEDGKLLRAESHGEVEVAVHQRGVWTPARGYRNRVLQSSSWMRIFYNDSGFVLRCGSREMRIQVKVQVPFNVAVKEGENATLPCRIPLNTANKCVLCKIILLFTCPEIGSVFCRPFVSKVEKI